MSWVGSYPKQKAKVELRLSIFLMSSADLLVMQDNRDKRVELLEQYAFKFFPSTKYLNYALQVETYTLQKAANLVLNVDGCIGTLFLDLLHSSSLFTEVRQVVVCMAPHMQNLAVLCCAVLCCAAVRCAFLLLADHDAVMPGPQ